MDECIQLGCIAWYMASMIDWLALENTLTVLLGSTYIRNYEAAIVSSTFASDHPFHQSWFFMLHHASNLRGFRLCFFHDAARRIRGSFLIASVLYSYDWDHLAKFTCLRVSVITFRIVLLVIPFVLQSLISDPRKEFIFEDEVTTGR